MEFSGCAVAGLQARHSVYEGVRGMDGLDAWIVCRERIEAAALQEIYGQIPPERYDGNANAPEKMPEQLGRRRRLVRELIVSAWKSSAQLFPNWE